jgi:Lysozyme inhibitor LprI
MKRSALVFASSIGLLLHGAAAQTNQPLSFETGGRAACAQAVQLPVPAAGENSRKFDLACAHHDLAIEKTEFDTLRKGMEKASPEQRVAFNALMVTFSAFRDLHAADATCRIGNGCGDMQTSEQALLNRDFLAMAEGLASAPSFNADDLARDDSTLNAIYQKALALLPLDCPAANYNCMSQGTFRETQRAWIRYRDAWITFSGLRWPLVTEESWRTHLTRQRTKQIEDTFGITAPAPAKQAPEMPENHVN